MEQHEQVPTCQNGWTAVIPKAPLAMHDDTAAATNENFVVASLTLASLSEREYEYLGIPGARMWALVIARITTSMLCHCT